MGRAERGRVVEGFESLSYWVAPGDASAASGDDPCAAPKGLLWLWARPRDPSSDPDWRFVGKWMIRVSCRPARYCWPRVRETTEQGTLGIGAKVTTETRLEAWQGKRVHVVMVYTADFRDRDDVARVGRRLAEIDAVRKQTLLYKPDAFTWAGLYAGNAPGEVAIYEMAPPFDALQDHPENLRSAEQVIDEGLGLLPPPER